MRLLFFITLLSSHLFAIITAPIHTSVTSIDKEKKLITIPTHQEAKVGMYGVIVHWFDKSHSTALSWTEVKSIEGETITLSMTPIHALEQNALPSGRWEAKVGDEVILGYNYHRALLISPNSKIYKAVTQSYTERTWVHPDIFTAVLSMKGHPTPLKEDFAYACRTNNIGLVYFSLEDTMLTVDCQSFKILKSESNQLKTEKSQLPFYTRIRNIEANWFGSGNEELEEYAPYYIELLSRYNPQSKWVQEYKPAQVQPKKESSWFDSWSIISKEDKENVQ